MLTRGTLLEMPAALAARAGKEDGQAEAPHICRISGWNL